MLKELVEAQNTSENDGQQVKSAIQVVRSFFFKEEVRTQDLKDEAPTMSDIYDKLVDLWVSCLPQNTPGSARLAKERLVRTIAPELYLSSMMLSIRERSAIITQPLQSPKPISMILPVRGREGLSLIQGQQLENSSREAPLSSFEAPSGLQTPDPTPSVASRSRESSTIDSESREDEAIARLRAYALTVKSQPPLSANRSTILEQWPSTPGADPKKYIWKDTRKGTGNDSDLDSDEEKVENRRKEEARRQRRLERHLKRQRPATLETASQPNTIVSGSQRDFTQHTVSSQLSAPDVPMTQPDRGAFGSRLGLKGSKKRRKGGF